MKILKICILLTIHLHVCNFAVNIIFIVQQTMFNLWKVYHIHVPFHTMTHVSVIFSQKQSIDV